MTLEHWAALLEASGAKKDDKGFLVPPEGKLLTLYVASGSATLSGDTLIIRGSKGTEEPVADRLFVYERTGSDWQLTQTLYSEGDDAFGALGAFPGRAARAVADAAPEPVPRPPARGADRAPARRAARTAEPRAPSP